LVRIRWEGGGGGLQQLFAIQDPAAAISITRIGKKKMEGGRGGLQQLFAIQDPAAAISITRIGKKRLRGRRFTQYCGSGSSWIHTILITWIRIRIRVRIK
jgi:hypothetical protein